MNEDALREQQAALRKRIDAQQQANRVLAQRIQKEGQAAIDVLLTLARDIAAAEIVDAEINAQIRDNADRIVGADMLARYRPPAPRETISETKTSLWVFAANGNLVGNQDEVQEWADGRGFLVGAPGHRTQCVRRGFRSIEYLEAEPHQHPEPFYAALRLPGISGPAWSPRREGASPTAILEALARRAEVPERQVLTELVPVDAWTGAAA